MVYSFTVILMFVQLLGIFFVISSENTYKTRQHNALNDLIHDFSNIIQKPTDEYIDLNLDFEDAFNREATGVYKLIPYYMKIYPKDNHQDRFIIQQNPFNGEFQLVKIFNYIYRKNLRSLFHPNQEIQQKKDLTTINSFHKYKINIKTLAEKNIILIKEIQNIQQKRNNLKNNFQNMKKDLHKNEEQRKRKMKEKKLKLKEEIFQLKLKNEKNIENIYDLQQTLQPKQDIIDEQKIMIEKLKLELSQFKYENVWLKDENLNLSNQLKTAKEHLNQEKDKNKIWQKQEKEIDKINEKINKMNDEHLLKLSNQLKTAKEHLNQEKDKNKILQKQEKEIKKINEKMNKMNDGHLLKLIKLDDEIKKLDEFKKRFEALQEYFVDHYDHFTKQFPENFKKLSQKENRFRLKNLICDEELERDPDFEYELALINYGFFKHAEYFQINNIIQIAEEDIFDPNTLELSFDNEYNELNIHVPEDKLFDSITFTLDHANKNK